MRVYTCRAMAAMQSTTMTWQMAAWNVNDGRLKRQRLKNIECCYCSQMEFCKETKTIHIEMSNVEAKCSVFTPHDGAIDNMI